MHYLTVAANTLLKKALLGAAVESYGLSHQILILEFRDSSAEDHLLSIETQVTSNTLVGEGLPLSEEEGALLLFHKVNLRTVTHVQCDDQANLVIEFDNNVQLRFSGNPSDGFPEPWTLGNQNSLSEGGYSIRAFSGGHYDIRDNSDSSKSVV